MKRWLRSSSGFGIRPLGIAVTAATLVWSANRLSADTVQLLSARSPSVAQSANGNGGSVAPVLSADGRYVVFSSSANDLVTNDNGFLGLDVFLRDRASNSTVLVSVNLNNTGGGNGQSEYGLVSTNGRYVMFESLASNLVPSDTNDSSDVFVRDVTLNSTTLISVSTNGDPGNGVSSDAVMTPDGRYVAFVSTANNLVSGDINGIPDIFVRDLVAGTTTLVSTGAINVASGSAFMSPPAITPDGRYVVFSSNARGLAPGIPASPTGEVYVRDLVAGSTFWASTNAVSLVTNVLNVTSATAASSQAFISDDGRYVAFKVAGTNSTSRYVKLILQFDTVARTTTLINTNGVLPYNEQNDDLYGPEMSPDGRFVVYAGLLVNTNTMVIQQWDANTGTNVLVSADLEGNIPTNSTSHSAKMSPDGRFVAFLSNATNLVAAAVSSGFHVYLRDLQAGLTQLVDANTNGVGATDDWGTIPSLCGNGQFVAFSSRDGSLVEADDNSSFDVFVRDTVGATTELVSGRSPFAVAQTGDSLSAGGPFSISADGQWVTFTSFADDLVTNDFNNERDVFVHDQLTGSNLLVSVGLDGNAGLGGNSVTPVISADGRYVVFASLATNLVANDTNRAADIFRRDLLTGTTVLVNVNAGGSSLSTNDASAPAISADGRYVVFLNYTNSPAQMPQAFWRDTAADTTMMLNGASSIAPSLSADGQRVVYFNSLSYLLVWDASLGANLYTNTTAMASAAISPDGARVLYQTTARQLNVRDLAAQTNILIASTGIPIRSPGQWSGDGRFFVFATATSLVAGDVNGTNDVYLCDLLTGTLTLVSANASGTASANGPSDWPVMSGDGRFVVYRTSATDVSSGLLNPPALIAFDRLTGAAGVLTTGTPGSGWSSWVTQPVISSNATAVAFLSWDSGLVGGDLNRASDVFEQTVSTPPGTDSDGDGIPDWWMQQNFGHPTGQAGDQSLAGDDADGDGLSNLQEYLAGTLPKDPNSVFRVAITAVSTPGGNVLLTWPAVPGRSYQVQYKDDLNEAAWQNASGGVTVLGSQARYTAPAVSLGRFYRVVLVN